MMAFPRNNAEEANDASSCDYVLPFRKADVSFPRSSDLSGSPTPCLSLHQLVRFNTILAAAGGLEGNGLKEGKAKERRWNKAYLYPVSDSDAFSPSLITA